MTDQSSEIDALFAKVEPSKFLNRYLSSEITEIAPDFDDETSGKSSKKSEQPEVDEEERNKRTLFLGNLPAKVTMHQIKSLVGKNLVESVRLRNYTLSKTPLKKQVAVRRHLIDENGTCSAYVVMNNESDVDEALNRLNGYEYMDHVIRADHAKLKGQKEKIDPDTNRRTVFIGHVPYDATEDEIRGYFEKCGEIHHVRIPCDERGKSKGVCYVTFVNEDDVSLALQFDGSAFRKEKITVQRSNPAKAEKMKKKKEQIETMKKERKLAKKDKPTGKFGNRKKRIQANPLKKANSKPRSKSVGSAQSTNTTKKTDTSFEGRHSKSSKLDQKNLNIRKYIKMRAHVNKKRKGSVNDS